MSYDVQETSAVGGSPVEGFEFILGGQTFRYTTQTEQVVLGGLLYTPLEAKRSKVELTKERNGGQVTVELPSDNEVVKLYRDAVPVNRLSLTIRRAHRTDTPTPQVITFWKGIVTNVRFRDLRATMTAEPIISFFQGEFPRRTYQSLCNFFLFDSDCALNRASFSDNVTVDTINKDTLVLDSLSTARPADTTFYKGGFVERANGDKRSIIDYTFATDTVRIGPIPFSGIEVGETVIARAGCDRSRPTCKTKFNNVINFGGFADVPGRNPFETGI